MGFFDMIGGLLDENSPNSLENQLNTALDSVEMVLGQTLDTAEQGIQKLDSAVTSVQGGAEHFVNQSDTVLTRVSDGGHQLGRSIDGILPGGKN